MFGFVATAGLDVWDWLFTNCWFNALTCCCNADRFSPIIDFTAFRFALLDFCGQGAEEGAPPRFPRKATYVLVSGSLLSLVANVADSCLGCYYFEFFLFGCC